jgi:hypothetical protein
MAVRDLRVTGLVTTQSQHLVLMLVFFTGNAMMARFDMVI